MEPSPSPPTPGLVTARRIRLAEVAVGNGAYVGGVFFPALAGPIENLELRNLPSLQGPVDLGAAELTSTIELANVTPSSLWSGAFSAPLRSITVENVSFSPGAFQFETDGTVEIAAFNVDVPSLVLPANFTRLRLQGIPNASVDFSGVVDVSGAIELVANQSLTTIVLPSTWSVGALRLTGNDNLCFPGPGDANLRQALEASLLNTPVVFEVIDNCVKV